MVDAAISTRRRLLSETKDLHISQQILLCRGCFLMALLQLLRNSRVFFIHYPLLYVMHFQARINLLTKESGMRIRASKICISGHQNGRIFFYGESFSLANNSAETEEVHEDRSVWQKNELVLPPVRLCVTTWKQLGLIFYFQSHLRRSFLNMYWWLCTRKGKFHFGFYTKSAASTDNCPKLSP